MANRNSIIAQSIATNGVLTVTPWSKALDQLEKAGKYWLATVNSEGHPHVMPVFGVWLNGRLYFTSNSTTHKAKNISHNPRCVISTTGITLDLIIIGEAVKVIGEARLRRVAQLYNSKYGWHLKVQDGAYLADFGAPSAGPPPYELYEVAPISAFGLGIEVPYGATRWRFSKEG